MGSSPFEGAIATTEAAGATISTEGSAVAAVATTIAAGSAVATEGSATVATERSATVAGATIAGATVAGSAVATAIAAGATVASEAARATVGATIATERSTTVATERSATVARATVTGSTVARATVAGAAKAGATIATADRTLAISKRLAISGAGSADSTEATERSATIARAILTREAASLGGSLLLDSSSIEFVADVNKATLAAGTTVVGSSLFGAGTTEVSVDTNAGSNDALRSEGAALLTVDTVGVEALKTFGSFSLEITSSLEVKVEVDVSVLLDLGKSEVELLLVIDIKVFFEVAAAFDLFKAEVKVLLVSDIKLLLEVSESLDLLASLEVSGATGVDGLGVALLLGSRSIVLSLPSEGSGDAKSGGDSLEHCG